MRNALHRRDELLGSQRAAFYKELLRFQAFAEHEATHARPPASEYASVHESPAFFDACVFEAEHQRNAAEPEFYHASSQLDALTSSSGGTGRGSRCRGCRGSPAGSAGSLRGGRARSPCPSARAAALLVGDREERRHHVLHRQHGEAPRLARALANAQRRVPLQLESPARPRSVHSTGSAPASQTARAPASSAAHDARTRTHAPRRSRPSASATSSDVQPRRRRRRGGRGGGRGVGGDTDEGVGDGADGVAFAISTTAALRAAAFASTAIARRDDGAAAPPPPPARRRGERGAPRPLSRSRAPRPLPKGRARLWRAARAFGTATARRRPELGGEHSDEGGHRRLLQHELLRKPLRVERLPTAVTACSTTRSPVPPPISRTREAQPRRVRHERRLPLAPPCASAATAAAAAACRGAGAPRIPAAGRAGRRRPPTPRGAAPLRAPPRGAAAREQVEERRELRRRRRRHRRRRRDIVGRPRPPRRRRRARRAEAQRAQRKGHAAAAMELQLVTTVDAGVEEDRRDGQGRRAGARRGARGRLPGGGRRGTPA